MQWQEIKSGAKVERRRRRARGDGRGRALPSSVWTSDAGYQIAVVDARYRGKGWALWRRRGAGFVRLVPELHLASVEGAQLIAELEHRRRRIVPRLVVGFVALASPLFRRSHTRLVEAARAHHPEEAERAALLGRYLEALREERPHGQARR